MKAHSSVSYQLGRDEHTPLSLLAEAHERENKLLENGHLPGNA